MTRLRWWTCAVAGAGAVLAAVHLAAGDPRGAPASRSADTPASPAPAEGAARTGALDDFVGALSRHRGPEAARGELFSAQSWAPPVSASRPASQPAPIARPPFPFVYAGRLKHGEAEQVYLARGAELVPIAPGAVLDAVWKIDAVSEDRIEVTFVPAGEQLSMLYASLVRESDASAPRLAAGTPSTPAPSQDGSLWASSPASPPVAPSNSTGGFAPGGASPLAAPAGKASTPSAASTAPLAAAPAAAVGSGPATPGDPPTGSFPQGPTPTGILGSEPPTTGSMPRGSAAGASGATPPGKN